MYIWIVRIFGFVHPKIRDYFNQPCKSFMLERNANNDSETNAKQYTNTE